VSHGRRSVPALSARLRGPLRTAVFALGAQAGLALVYLALTDAGIAEPPVMAVPLVWITAGVVAVRHAPGVGVGGWRRAIAVGVGVAYGLGLAWVAGLVAVGAGGAGTLDVALLPPWWGPTLRYHGVAALTLFPYRVVGYAALSYLVAVVVGRVLSASSGGRVASLGGLAALFSCVGCAAPLLTAAGVAIGGAGSGALAASLSGGVTAHLLGTGAYLLAVGLLAVGVGVSR